MPRSLRRALYGRYCARYGVRMEESATPLEEFRTFNAFFTRRLRDGLRPIDTDPKSVTSPVDARVAAFGAIERGRLLQAKGLDYALEDLVVVPELVGSLLGGSFVTLYLAPGDYHRIHAPFDGSVPWAIHEPGTLWPVNDAAAATIRDLFVVNERVVTALETAHGTIAIVKVGALNVGSIRVEFDSAIGPSSRRKYRVYATSQKFTKGEELARFEMGSTVILLLPRAFAIEMDLALGKRIRVGEAVARVR
ncbi:MAG: phosphatidylserine decarboxylase [Planctomycetes bacterium]|nr:phosphatidylserine decarboxylase [Planctomycetota bacterium]